jgi:uroporphyrinogen decarboxylase
MTSKERVLLALNRKIPDRVPWVEGYVNNVLAEKLLKRTDFQRAGEMKDQLFSVCAPRISPDIFEVLALDNLSFNIAPPRFVKTHSLDGIDLATDGLIKTEADLEKVRLPDPDDDRVFFSAAKDFIARHREKEKALAVSCRSGIAIAFQSIGFQDFCLMLYDQPDFVIHVLDLFNNWCVQAMDRIAELDFDFMIWPEDIAWKNAPFFPIQVFREMLLPRMKKCAERVKIPWIYHSDGNLMPILEDLLSLGMSGLANIEPAAMDINFLKKEYGHRICLMGNIDIHYTLTQGTPEETEVEVERRIREVGENGGYILASENGLTSYCKAENVLAMSRALLKYGIY